MAKFSDIPKPDSKDPEAAPGPDTSTEEHTSFERPFAEEEAAINARDRVPNLEDIAYHGPWGDIAKRLAARSELDPKAILASGLVAYGNSVSRRPYLVLGKMKHYPVENLVLVGDTAQARKGTSASVVRDIMHLVDPPWKKRVVSNLSTGEGLISEVQDDVYAKVKDRKTKEWNLEITVAGEDDKRLLADCREFSQVFTVMTREGNTLATALCDFWDCLPYIRSPVRTSRAAVTEPRISIIGGITLPVLRAVMGPEHKYSGFGNRFNWLRIHRPRIELDLAHSATALVLKEIEELRRAHAVAQMITYMTLAPDVHGYVHELYQAFESRTPNPLLVRGFQHLIRHAEIYALSLGQSEIQRADINAALALYRVYEASTLSIFPAAELPYDTQKLLDFLMTRGTKGATRKEIHKFCFGGHKTGPEILETLKLLKDRGKSEMRSTPTKGRPEERWFAIFTETTLL